MNKFFTKSEIDAIADAIFMRRYEAKMNLEKIEEGRMSTDNRDYWQKIFNECDSAYIKFHIYTRVYCSLKQEGE